MATTTEGFITALGENFAGVLLTVWENDHRGDRLFRLYKSIHEGQRHVSDLALAALRTVTPLWRGLRGHTPPVEDGYYIEYIPHRLQKGRAREVVAYKVEQGISQSGLEALRPEVLKHLRENENTPGYIPLRTVVIAREDDGHMPKPGELFMVADGRRLVRKVTRIL